MEISPQERMLQAFFASRNIRLEDDALLLWLDALSDLTPEELATAIRGFTRDSTEYPTPAALRKFAGAKGLGNNERAIAAWNATRKAISGVGGYATVKFDDPFITATIRELGGWVRICDMTSAELDKLKWDFWKTYEVIAKSGIGDASPLPGICDRTNAKLGYSPQEPAVAVATGLPLHPAAAALPVVEREPMRLEHRFGQVVNGALVDHVREVIESRPEPVKDSPRDAESERAKLLAAYPEAGASKDGKAAS